MAPRVIAHRGGAGLWPENTLAAFTAAHALGCVLETDVRLTSDGVPVAFHDATLDRVTDGRGELARTSSAELADLRTAGHPVPTIERVLMALPDAPVVLDLKDPAAAAPLAGLIADLGAADRVCVTGCWDGPLAALRRTVGPALATGLGWRSLACLVAGVPVPGLPPRAGRGRTWAFVPVQALRPGLVGRAHRLGLTVAVWTVDDAVGLARVTAAGVDAVVTDRPDLALGTAAPGTAALGTAGPPAGLRPRPATADPGACPAPSRSGPR